MDPILPILIPLIGAFILSLLHKKDGIIISIFSLILAATTAFVSTVLVFRVFNNGPQLSFLGGWAPQIGIMLLADKASILLVLLVAWGHFLTLTFRFLGNPASDWSGKFPVFLSIFTASIIGMSLTADFFNLFVFVELSTVASIGLMVRKPGNNGALAGFMYLVLAMVSGSLLLIGIILIYYSTGTLSMALALTEIPSLPPELYWGIILCFTLSLGMKFGLIPMHFWQPWAYHAAGCTFAGFMSGFGMKAYLFVLFRVLWIPLGIDSKGFFSLLLYWGLGNILVGHVMAFLQRDYKKLMAFSSIAHVGYIICALGIAGIHGNTPLGILALSGGLYHMVIHSLVKPALLWTGRSFLIQSNTSLISQLKGSPQALVIFVMAALGIVGIPPTGGFTSKFIIASTALGTIPVIIIVFGTLVSAVYYLRIFITVHPKLIHGLPLSKALMVPGFLALLVFILGFLPSVLLPILQEGASAIMDRSEFGLTILGYLP